MTRDEHIAEHKRLHLALDQLLADFVRHTNGYFSNTSILKLMQWSHSQTIEPDDGPPKRPDAEELLAIRAGAWPYEKLVEWATVADQALEGVAKVSPLPREPDRVALDRLLVSVVEAAP